MFKLRFYLQKSPDGQRYHARPLNNIRRGKSELIEMMIEEDPSLSRELVERVFRQARSSTERLLSEGNYLVIPGFATIKTVIKGSFKDSTEPFNERKHSIVPTFSFSKTFVNYFKGKVKAMRVDQSGRNPYIEEVTNSRGEVDLLSRRLVTKYKGYFLKERSWEFVGVKLCSCYDNEKEIAINAAELDLVNHTGKELTFGLGPYFKPPAWLEEEKELYLGLTYRKSGVVKDHTGSYYRLDWKGDGE